MRDSSVADGATENLAFLEARRLTALLQAREISAVEVMETCLERIESLDPLVNAIPTVRPPCGAFR